MKNNNDKNHSANNNNLYYNIIASRRMCVCTKIKCLYQNRNLTCSKNKKKNFDANKHRL